MAASAAAMPRVPRRHLPWLLLAVSLALNLFFIGGALWFWPHKPIWRLDPAKRVERMSAELNLDADHQRVLQRYFRAVAAGRKLMRSEVQPLIGKAWAEIAKPQPDAARISKLFDAAVDKRQEFRRQLISETLTFLATLTPEQRQKFVRLAYPPPPHRPPP